MKKSISRLKDIQQEDRTGQGEIERDLIWCSVCWWSMLFWLSNVPDEIDEMRSLYDICVTMSLISINITLLHYTSDAICIHLIFGWSSWAINWDIRHITIAKASNEMDAVTRGDCTNDIVLPTHSSRH